MTETEAVARLQKLTGETDADLMTALYQDACETVLDYTHRTHMIPALEKPARDLAVIAYNRMGTEGEKSRNGAGESYSFDDVPESVYGVLRQYRLARVGGVFHEAEEKQD